MLDRKSKYAEFCQQRYVPLMFRSYWLDAVCPDAWDVCLTFDQGGNVTGALAYHLSKYKGFPVIKMPPLTDYSGVWLHYPSNLSKNTSCYTFDKEVMNALMAQLPRVAFFYQQWHPAVENWLPFFWKNFRQTTLYTYRLSLTEEVRLFENLKAATRTHIRKASAILQIEMSDDVTSLYELVAASFQRQRLRPPFELSVLQRLHAALAARGLCRIYFAVDQQGFHHAGAYIVWDERCAYYLLSGARPSLRDSSALYLLLWRAIQDQIGKAEVFDFMGSTLESVERVFRSFGGTLTPHFKVFKAQNKILQLLSVLLSKGFY